MTVKAKRLDNGVEFDLDADCFTHGVASYRIGLSERDCPFLPDANSCKFQSWMAGWDLAAKLARSSQRAKSND